MNSGNTSLNRATRIILWLISANALAGALSLIFFPDKTEQFFFWTINPPINAALFGALYLGGAVVVGWVAYRGEWEPARFLIPVLVSAGILITVTTLIHIDRFVSGFKLVYWLVIYIGAPLLAVFLYWYYERSGTNWTISEPVAQTTRLIASVLGGILIVLGLVILAAPSLVIGAWPWPTTALMIRVFAAWFTAFGVGLVWFLFERDWQRVRHVATLMIAASVLDLAMIFIHRADLTPPGMSLWIYSFHLALFGVAGGLMYWLQRKKSPAEARA